MKGVLAVHLCAAVLAAFCDAPFVHFHLNSDTDHARQAHQGKGLAGHSHGSFTAIRWHDQALEAAESDDEDAVFLTWLQSCPQTKPIIVATLPVFTALVAAALPVVHSVTVPVPRSHDPPYQLSVRPRSPPPFESLLTV